MATRLDFNSLSEEQKEAVLAFEKYYAGVASELLRLVAEVPELARHIDVAATFNSYPDVILGERMRLRKEDYEKLLRLGYEVDVGCVACCGYGGLEVNEDGEYIEFEAVDCMCHPGAYFLVLRRLRRRPR